MDLEIKVEQNVRIVIHFKTFIAIDIFQRGFYQLKLRCYKKSASPLLGSKRLDGIITQIYPVDETDLKGFLNFDSLQKPDPLAESRSVSYEKCTVAHRICTWKCAKTLTGVDPGPTVFLTRPFYILKVGEKIPLHAGVCFELQSNFKLYDSDYRQEDAAILDVELFFHSERAPDPIEGISIQRRMIKIESPSKVPIIRPIYTQIGFDNVYFSSLDLSIQCLPVINRISKRLSKLTSSDPVSNPWSLKSIMKSIPALYSVTVNDLGNVQQDSMDDIAQTKVDLKSFLACQIFIALGVSSLEKIWATVSGLFDRKPVIDVIDMESVYKELYSNFKIIDDYQLQKKAITELGVFIESLVSSIIVSNPFSVDKEIEAARTAYRINDMRLNHYNYKISFEDFQKRTAMDYTNLIPANNTPESQVHFKPYIPNEVAVFEISENMQTIHKHSKLELDQNPVLFVCVHGLLGDSYDLRLFQNRFLQITTDLAISTAYVYFLHSKANQGQTFDSLEIMGTRLASEIQDFIKDRDLESPIINFVCHSLGGLIARVSLRDKCFDKHRKNLGQFISFSSPHLSLLLHNHSILHVALSIYQSVYPAKVIDQLYLRDHPDARECLLFKLSKDDTLKDFKQILLYSSTLDLYVHLEGALGTKLRKEVIDEKTIIFKEMVFNFEAATCLVDVKRFICEFKSLGQRSQDGWVFSGDPLGREAHLKLVTAKVLDIVISLLLQVN
jgi:Putative serine esterase (DUF676)